MKKLLIAGCSHSVGYGLKANDPTWYGVVGEKHGYEITNIASPASSINYSLQSISDAIIDDEYDAIIFQLTDFSRYTIPFDGEGPFLSTDITDFKYNTNTLLHLCKAHYIDTLKGKYLNLDIKPEVIKFIFEKITLSRFNINSMFNQLHFIQQYLKSRKIKMALVPYDYNYWGKQLLSSIWKLEESKKIDLTYFIEYPFMKWLNDNYDSDKFYIDNGYHLNAKGQLLFANEYLIPRLKKLNFF